MLKMYWSLTSQTGEGILELLLQSRYPGYVEFLGNFLLFFSKGWPNPGLESTLSVKSPNSSLFHVVLSLFHQPERILGDEYSIRSELWSLGVSLLEVTKKTIHTYNGHITNKKGPRNKMIKT